LQQERKRVFQQKLKSRDNIAIFSFIAAKQLDYSNLYTRHREKFQTWIFSVLARSKFKNAHGKVLDCNVLHHNLLVLNLKN
jgi:hypothetical protein